ncbi:hypothetical protein PENTCL1PPCAC_9562, partial [Pristionchus entomophagus]
WIATTNSRRNSTMVSTRIRSSLPSTAMRPPRSHTIVCLHPLNSYRFDKYSVQNGATCSSIRKSQLFPCSIINTHLCIFS